MAAITELHYSDAYSNSSGINEFIEITLEPTENPADFTLSVFNANSNVYLDVQLTDARFTASTPDPVTGRVTYVIQDQVPAGFSFRLTDPNANSTVIYEAFALTNTSTNTLISFWDIGGGTQNIPAAPGSAAALASPGATSTNIPVPTTPGSATYSVQFTPENPTTPITTLPANPGMPSPCFLPGTLLMTPHGPRAIEVLRAGDQLITQDRGTCAIRWIGGRTLARWELMLNPKLHPVRIMAGALGDGLPQRDLLVSRQHRFVVASPIVRRMFGEEAVLIPAIRLTELPGIFIDETLPTVAYFHVLLDQHSVIDAEGAPTESLYLGTETAHALSPDGLAEIAQIFPDLLQQDRAMPRPALPIPAAKAQRSLMARHAKNGKPPLS